MKTFIFALLFLVSGMAYANEHRDNYHRHHHNGHHAGGTVKSCHCHHHKAHR